MFTIKSEQRLKVTRITLEEIREILKALQHLCKKSEEWGGYLDPETKKIEMLARGGKSCCKRGLSPREQKKRAWMGFHTHTTKASPPTFRDVCVAHWSSCREYVMTIKGIYEIELNSMSLICMQVIALDTICDEESLSYKKLEKRNGITSFLAKPLLRNYPRAYEDILRRIFPVRVNFIPW